MWLWLAVLAVLAGPAAWVQVCTPGADAALKPVAARPMDLQFIEFLGFLATRYVPSGSTLVLCLSDANTALPWRHLQGRLNYVPIMAMCPGAGSKIPAGLMVSFMVAGTPHTLLRLLPQMSAASETSFWYSNMMLVVRADEDTGDHQEALVRELMTITWERSWVQTAVAVAGREWGTLYLMAPFANSTGVCGRQPPVVVPAATVRLADKESLTAMPDRLYGDELIPRDLGGCVVRATVIVSYLDRCGYTGDSELPIEALMVGSILTSVAQYRNTQLDINYVPDERILDYHNGTFSGALGDLGSGTTDVVLGSLAMLPGRMKYFRATVSYLQMPIRVVARCPYLPQFQTQRRARLWNVMFRSLWGAGTSTIKWSVFLTVCAWITVFLRVAIAGVSGVVPRTPGWWRSVAYAALMDAWAMGWEVYLPAWRLCPELLSSRVLTGAWLLFLLNLNVVIKGLLLTESALARPVAFPQTIAQLLAAMPNLTVATPTDSMRLTVNATGVPLEQVVSCETQQEVRQCEDNFARTTSYAVAVGNLPSRLKCLRGCRYTLPSTLVQANYVNYVQRSYVLVELLDEAIHRLQNGGLLQQLITSEVEKRKSKANRSLMRHRRGQRRRDRASFDPFYILLGGLLLACVAFVAEHVAYRLSVTLGASS